MQKLNRAAKFIISNFIILLYNIINEFLPPNPSSLLLCPDCFIRNHVLYSNPSVLSMYSLR